ncbi:pyridoxamine 5'-phosphate oxidase family protein [Pantoea sp. EA-12]|uniref:pyridoxamine 5'-phosphate oxidase family protein n=1 Tax=Pantoea sp. EA-12 TaxID=3043303 RepID=UPI0024B5933E|nr:pyridoxamine 5'-phosphate oxidase family protein [Pantoea sp. EA-12]MDI9221525.1 pyridoxamine 5'-phosphate oxidase family protein [Pantoea sp. EA-12]
MPLSFDQIDEDCWKTLETGADDHNSGFHFLTMAPVAQQGKPQARTLVLRRFDHVTRTLEFHTDMRGPKWRALKTNPDVPVLGYSNKTQLLLQFNVNVIAS